MPTAKSPDFYTLNPKENCVLYCEKVNGELGKFKYIPIEEVPFGNSTVGKVIEELVSFAKSQERQLNILETFCKKQAQAILKRNESKKNAELKGAKKNDK